jgi:hypothetical protein
MIAAAKSGPGKIRAVPVDQDLIDAFMGPLVVPAVMIPSFAPVIRMAAMVSRSGRPCGRADEGACMFWSFAGEKLSRSP